MPNSTPPAPRAPHQVLTTLGIREAWRSARNPYKRFEFRVRPWAGDEAMGTRIDILIDAMADLFHVKREVFRTAGVRDSDLVFAQQLTWYILRDRWKLPATLIASYFDHDRTTITYGVNIVSEAMDMDPDFATFVDMLPYYTGLEIAGPTQTALCGLLYPEGMVSVPEPIKTPPRARKRAKKGIEGEA